MLTATESLPTTSTLQSRTFQHRTTLLCFHEIYKCVHGLNVNCVQPDEGSVSQLSCSAWTLCVTHSIHWGEPSLWWVLETNRKPALKHHPELLLTSGRTVIRRVLTLLYPLAVIKWMCLPVYYTLLPLLSISLSLSLSKCFCDMWIVSLLLCTDVVLSCVVIACQMTTKCLQQ